MPNGMPLNTIRYVHKWMRGELASLESEAQQLAGATPETVALFVERLSFFHAGTKAHIEGEEKVLWPALEAKVPQVTVPYAYDHEADEKIFQQLHQLLERLQGAVKSEDRARICRQIVREVEALNDGIARHVDKENIHHLPLAEELFNLPEQADLARGMGALLPPDVSQRGMPLIFMAISADEREDFLRLMQRAMPAPVFAHQVESIRAGMPPADWQELAARMPELGGGTKM